MSAITLKDLRERRVRDIESEGERATSSYTTLRDTEKTDEEARKHLFLETYGGGYHTADRSGTQKGRKCQSPFPLLFF